MAQYLANKVIRQKLRTPLKAYVTSIHPLLRTRAVTGLVWPRKEGV